MQMKCLSTILFPSKTVMHNFVLGFYFAGTSICSTQHIPGARNAANMVDITVTGILEEMKTTDAEYRTKTGQRDSNL